MTETAPLAKSAAQRALAIDPALSEAHSVLGLVAGSVEYDWKSAECHFQAAMAVKPVPPLAGSRPLRVVFPYTAAPIRGGNRAVSAGARN
jgi:hypothetical protein